MPNATLSHLGMYFTENPFKITIPAAPSELDRAKLICIAKVKVRRSWGSSIDDILTSLVATERPDGTGFDFFIDQVFKRWVKLKSTPPDPTLSQITEIETLTWPFYLTYGYYIDGVLQGSESDVVPQKYVFKGGLSWLGFADQANLFFTSYQANRRKFLTWQPTTKYISTDQPEFLYYLINFTPLPAGITLKVNITYIDDTTETISTHYFNAPDQYRVYCIPVGFKALNLQLRTKEVRKYAVWLENANGETISETRTYRIDTQAFRKPTCLLLQNSFGCFDTFRFTGNAEYSLESARETAESFLSPGYTRSFLENFTFSSSAFKAINLATGNLEKEWADYLSQVELSKQVYEIAESKLIPLININQSLKLPSKFDRLHAANFKFRYAFSDENHSKLDFVENTDTGGGTEGPDVTPSNIPLVALKDASNNHPASGTEVLVAVGVQNNSGITVTNVIVTDVLPTGMSFVSASNPNVSHASGTVTCTFPAIAPGAQGILQFYALITAANSTEVVNTATIQSCNEGTIATANISKNFTFFVTASGSGGETPNEWIAIAPVTYTPSTTLGAFNFAQFGDFETAPDIEFIYQGVSFVNHGTGTRPNGFNPLTKGFKVLGKDKMTNAEKASLAVHQRAHMVGAAHFSQAFFGLNWCDLDGGDGDGVYLDPFVDSWTTFELAVLAPGGICTEFGDCPVGDYKATVKWMVFDLENVQEPPVQSSNNGDNGFLVPGSPGFDYPSGLFPEAYRQEQANRYTFMCKKTQEWVLSRASGNQPKLGTYNPGGPLENFYMGIRNTPSYPYTHAENYRHYLWTKQSNRSVGDSGLGTSMREWCEFATVGTYFNTTVLGENRSIYMLIIENEVYKILETEKPNCPVQWVIPTDNESISVSHTITHIYCVFTIMIGIKTAWLWDNDNPTKYFEGYEGYIAALKRFSPAHHAAMADIFNGSQTYINPEISFDNGFSYQSLTGANCQVNGRPIVRAVKNGSTLLVAAHNPQGTGTQNFLLRYQPYGFVKEISLVGAELFLKRIIMA